jgi:amidase
MRIGVIRKHMDKKVFNEADVEAIDLTERAIDDLRRLGATIIDPGPGGALLQSCIDKYVPLYRNRVFIEQFASLFPLDANGKPLTDRISQLVDMFFDPSLVPTGSTIRNIAGASNAGLTKYMLTRYLRERGDANIKSQGSDRQSLTDSVDDDPAMPDALEVAAQQDSYLGRATGFAVTKPSPRLAREHSSAVHVATPSISISDTSAVGIRSP